MTGFEPIEMFVADPHGEYEEFSHILRSACGTLRTTIDQVFGETLTDAQKDELACALYYPADKRSYMEANCADPAAWEEDITRKVALIYSYVFRKNPDEGANFETMAQAIQYAAVTQLHVMGDIYDRGPAPELILDEMMDYPNLDIQWGNHDILWMGAALGQPACVATVVRICARYGNLSVLTSNYGMDLSALEEFANRVYGDDPCDVFFVKHNPALTDAERWTTSRVQKAIAMIQFKVEARIIAENPDFNLDHRNLLHKIDYVNGTVDVDGTVLPMLDMNLPTVDPADPYRLTPEEAAIMDGLVEAFVNCPKLQAHAQLFLQKGSLYKVVGDTLLFHACVPLNPDGSLMESSFYGKSYAGKALFDAVEGFVRDAYLQTDPVARKQGQDMIWYLWLGIGSPLFAKSKMATFELYFVADKAAQKEVKNSFYNLLQNEEAMDGILRDFGMDPARSRMICGHVPVKVKDGEDPVKCGGKIMIIDGGMSKPYQKNTGVAGFTVICDNAGMKLATHATFCGRKAAVADNLTLQSTWREV